jgi:hypothetical protein
MRALASNKVSHGSDAEWKYTTIAYYTLEKAGSRQSGEIVVVGSKRDAELAERG